MENNFFVDRVRNDYYLENRSRL